VIPAHVFTKAGAELQPDEQLRIDHSDCPSGQDTRGRLYIKRKHDGTLLAYCHNCGDYGVHSSRGKTKAIRDLLIEHEAAQRNGAGELVLPPDIIVNPDAWPLEAQAWVYKYGITRDEIIDNELCYSPSWDRVILPVYGDGKLLYWQGRAVRKDQDPKYVSAKAHPKVMAWQLAPGKRTCDKIIIVEDRLSSIKVGRYVDSVALLGTSPDIDCLTERLQMYKKVGIILDPDQAGFRKGTELAARLSLVFRGRVMHYSSFLQQPKEMDDMTLAAISSGL
jgi:hypothetical protein